jgi:hypothetical protein
MRRRLVVGRRQAKREGGEGGEPMARKTVYAVRNDSTIMQSFHSNSSLRGLFLALALAALGTLTVTSGCLAVAAGAGAGTAVAYVRGDLDTTLNANFDRSDWAVNEAIKQLQFAKVSEKRDALQAIVIARNASDKKIELRLDKLADDATKLKIRVGTFGDDTLTQAVLERVKANLPVR